jgi:hypothetical protein
MNRSFPVSGIIVDTHDAQFLIKRQLHYRPWVVIRRLKEAVTVHGAEMTNVR